MKIVVVGGGIGGLAAALALAADGHGVTVAERGSGFAGVGAGIVLAPNAVRGLRALGVTVAGEGQRIDDVQIRSRGGRLLSRGTPEVGSAPGIGGPSYGITRARLHDLLGKALPASVETLFGTAITSVRGDGDRVELIGPGVELDADLVVAADGLRSAVRAQLPGRRTQLRYSGTTCWRGLLDFDTGEVATEAWGGRTRIGVVPVGGDRSYYFLVATWPPSAPGPDDVRGFADLFGGFGGVAGDLVGALTRVPQLRHDLLELDRPVWGHGRVLLLGDAAHAMTPNQGQGAAMAIEDAVALRLALRAGADGAAQRYRSLRGRRVRKVQLGSRRLGQVAHWTNPAAVALRNTTMQAMPPRMLNRRLTALVRPGVELAR